MAPATIAASQSRCAKARHARCKQYMEEEQAVSRVIDGPRKSNAWLTRSDITVFPTPVAL